MHRFGDDDEDDFEDEDSFASGEDEESAFVDEEEDLLDEEVEDEPDLAADADEEEQDELLADGGQRCPLCGKRGAPDDLDACEHYQAMVWDGEVILGGDDLTPAWEELEELWKEHDELFQDTYAEELDEKLVRAPLGVQRVVRDGLMDENPLFWTEDAETVDRERAGGGDPIGSGFAAYHRNADFMERLVADVQRARRWLQKFADSRLEDDD